MSKSLRLMAYTDGACKGNPGPGGWGAVLCWDRKSVVEMGGSCASTTNNQMELTAIAEVLAVAVARQPAEVEIFTDSRYAIDGATKWLSGWIRSGWVTSSGSQVLNQFQWQRISEFMANLKAQRAAVKWNHIPAHSGYAGNEQADSIASRMATGTNVELYDGSLADYPRNLFDFAAGQKSTATRPRSSSKGSAVYYLSFVDGVLRKHQTWDSCKGSVLGKKGALYKKVRGDGEALEIIAKWGLSAREFELL